MEFEICRRCGSVLKYKGDREGECDFCRRERLAEESRHNEYTSGELMEQILYHDVQMLRMYDADIERFGNTTKATAVFTGIVLVTTGAVGLIVTLMAGIHDSVGLSSFLLVVAGLVITYATKFYWRRLEQQTEKRNKRSTSDRSASD